ncbi:hypothetical protein AKJ09_10562 [Labilithrix luteola]|uniref:Uncharacterized protein n=1 Tax=Labilithrix luteola TaxID=1391654 RepID=A0A0K1QDR2_9BACT|nr:hypothetical protein [Labilithrix luteola]AKV03899.1 hypothetical protein AKJ09_10562 [Labilithrix luteola]
MRSRRSGLVGFAIAGLVGAYAVIGCSADGGGVEPDGLELDLADSGEDATEPESSTVLPPSTDASAQDSGPKDAGKDAAKDAGNDAGKDAGGTVAKDAGAPPPTPWTPCTTVDQIAARSCGMCGKQTAICQEVYGELVWTDYGPCQNEAGECLPGATQACGNCGTQTCSNTCGWGSCTGQPPSSCTPGTVEYTQAGCPTGGYKNRACGTACSWDPYTVACAVPTAPNKMTISATVGTIVKQQYRFPDDTAPKPNTSCNGLTTTNVRSFPVEVANPTSQTATLTVFNSKSPTTGADVDTVIWYYKGEALPMSDAERGQCTGTVTDSCSGTTPINLCGNASDTSSLLAGVPNVTIPPNGKIVVFTALWGSSTSAGDGTIMLNLKTDKLQ